MQMGVTIFYCSAKIEQVLLKLKCVLLKIPAELLFNNTLVLKPSSFAVYTKF